MRQKTAVSNSMGINMFPIPAGSPVSFPPDYRYLIFSNQTLKEYLTLTFDHCSIKYSLHNLGL